MLKKNREDRDVAYLLDLCGATKESKNPKIECMVKEKKGSQVIGVCGVIKRHGFIPAMFLAVKPKQQGKGIGKKLTKALLKKYSGPLFLTVSLSNKKAYSIYKKNGFIKIFPWRTIGNTKDIWVMVRI